MRINIEMEHGDTTVRLEIEKPIDVEEHRRVDGSYLFTTDDSLRFVKTATRAGSAAMEQVIAHG